MTRRDGDNGDICSHCDQTSADTPSHPPIPNPWGPQQSWSWIGILCPQGGQVTAPALEWRQSWGLVGLGPPPAEALTPGTTGLLSSARCRLKGVYRGGPA